MAGAARVREFWRARLEGLSQSQASARVGVSQSTGGRWIAESGGMIPDLAQRSGRYVDQAERDEISVGLAAGHSLRMIGRTIGRHPSTISRELARNHMVSARPGDHSPGSAGPPRGPARPHRRVDPLQAKRVAYRPSVAQAKADRRARRPKPSKLERNPALAAQVQDRLQRHWSPQQIAASLRQDYPEDPQMQVSHETIYQELYVQGRGSLRRELHRCLRTGRALRRPRRLTEHRGRRSIPPEIMISQRPAEAADRAVPGHWEGDLILGREHASAIGTLVERSTRFVMLLHLPDGYHGQAVRDAMIAAMQGLPATLRRSLAWDQGSEMARHREITIACQLPIYCCDPHSPWQRGSNENTNGLLRQYFPKGSDLSVHTAEHLTAVADELNARPRQTLGWATPTHMLDQLLSRPPTGVATTP